MGKSSLTKFKYVGCNEYKFFKDAVKLLYDAEVDDIIFLDGDMRNLSSNNIKVNKINNL
tara:strand:+ start:6980 stop:7156 length:177 start_codon:yes stop_codon:yes gene_type:complete